MTSFQYDIEIFDYNILNPGKLKLKDPYTKNNSFVKIIPIKDNKNNQNIFLLTPWTKIKKYDGIQNFNNNEINPSTFKIGFDIEEESHINFIKKLIEIDNYFNSDDFKQKYISEDYNGIYSPIYSNNCIKSKIDYDKENNINTTIYKTFSFPNNPSIFYKKQVEINCNDDFKKNIRYSSNIRLVLVPSCIWYTDTSYGIKIKLIEIQVGTNRQPFDYNLYN
jgi:hypothetical protein